MYRVTKMGYRVYAKKFDKLSAELSNIEGLLETDDHVLLVNELFDAAEIFDVAEDEIIVVEDE